MPFETHPNGFAVSIEVVPPAGPDARPILDALEALAPLPFDAFSVASNPVAKPRMSALTLSGLIQQRTGRPAIVHVTTRDHNRLSLQSLLWGARASGIRTVLAATGDYVALGERARTTTVRDVDVFDLVRMAREAGLRTGVVFQPHQDPKKLDLEVRRLERKVQAGAQFFVTQPVYDGKAAGALRSTLCLRTGQAQGSACPGGMRLRARKALGSLGIYRVSVTLRSPRGWSGS
jgi:homocysteine S-methyltransferase